MAVSGAGARLHPAKARMTANAHLLIGDTLAHVAAGAILSLKGVSKTFVSGSGKSTLLGLMAGLDRPSAGEIWLRDQPLHTMSEDGLALLRRRSVGFVFQAFELLPQLTAHENVTLPLELLGREGAPAEADALLARVGLGPRTHHYPSQLSGGEQQRVAIARAFAASPELLLADEPTGNLDGATGQAVLEVLWDLRRARGTTLVIVTHDPAVAARADRRIRLRDGRIET
jgi:putative ABC transport system ATP-binding protein